MSDTLTRPGMEEVFMLMALSLAARSTCKRLAVGAIVTNWDGTEVVALGYNGNAKKLPNACDTDTPGACGCVHAEMNALLKAPYDPNRPLRLYCTHSPCPSCCKLILNTSIEYVGYLHRYRDVSGVALLREHGLRVSEISFDPKHFIRIHDELVLPIIPTPEER